MGTGNRDERRAERWLRSQGLSVERQADDPPDFVVDGRYAVEVTRLNTIEDDVALREKEGLRRTIQEIVEEFEPSDDGTEYLVDVRFCVSRPLPPKSHVRCEVREALRRPTSGETVLKCGLALTMDRVRSAKNRRFHLGNVDSGMGSMALMEYAERIPKIVEEKTKRVGTRLDDYPERWLVLVDHVLFEPLMGVLGMHEMEALRAIVTSREPWDRIIVLSATEPHRCVDV